MTEQETVKKLKELHSYFYQFNDDRSSSICEAIMCALTAVEKQTMKEQEPMEPIIDEKVFQYATCRKCGQRLRWLGNYCHWCGQAVKWDV